MLSYTHAATHSLCLPLSTCLDCIQLLIGLPFLRILLKRMFMLPYAYYYVVVFVSSAFAFFCVFFVYSC